MRKNAAEERRLVYLAIEGISNTPTARKYGRGASCTEIVNYSNLKWVPVDAALKFLANWGLIYHVRTKWFIKTAPPDNFCWSHGMVRLFGGKCIKCFKQEGR